MNRLCQSLYLKMEKEGNLPAKDIARNFKNSYKQEKDIYEKILAGVGLEKLEDGKVIKKGERGKRGEKGETGEKGK